MTLLLKNLVMSAGLAAAMVALSPAAAQPKPVAAANAPSPKAPLPKAGVASSPVPSADMQIMLIRDSLAAFNHANLANDYRVMQALGSPGFRVANSAERLAQLFAPYRVNKVDLSPILFLKPTMSKPAFIENGRLRLTGAFPSAPMAVQFDLSFEPYAGRWKLFGLSVTLAPIQQAPAPRK